MNKASRRIGEMLIERGVLLPALLDEALKKQKEQGGRLGDILLADGAITEDVLYQTLAGQWGLDFLAELNVRDIDFKVLEKYPLDHLRRHKILPVHQDNDTLFVITSEPFTAGPLDEMSLETKKKLHVTIMPPSVIISILNENYGRGKDSREVIEDLTIEGGLEEELEKLQIEDVLASANKAPVIKFVNTTIFQALRERSSDIHLEPSPDGFRIRYRIDGVLFERYSPPRTLHAPITSRIKIMAGLDIAERRLPQDGKVRVKFGDREVDIRVSCVPSAHGERVVLRLLDRKAELLTLEQMGMEKDTLATFDHMIRRPNGILLVTGPTGSGKTTTLYGAIMRIMSPDLNIITLEDPVEYELKGANQIPVKPKIGFTFASGLRSILRQDPDVIMVGEIRDEETASMAIQAGLTGHMVFSTLHTNDSVGATIRLVDMKVEPYLVASTLVGALAQRLVRRLCGSCKTKSEDGTCQPVGCPACSNTGFRGRLGLFELMAVDEEVAALIGNHVSLDQIRAAVLRKGMRPLMEDGLLKVRAGTTCRSEVEGVCLQSF